jgi:hypothetical protein
MPLRVPDDLATRMAEGETVLFAGAGLSMPRLPGWRNLLEQMLSWASHQQIPLGGGAQWLRPDPVFAMLKDADKAAWVRTEFNQPDRPLRLLILDNAEDEASVREWIAKSGNCHTLLTSRFTAWSPGVETCPVWILQPEPALELLLRRSGRASDEACGAVAGKLDYLPLALEHSAAYVAEQRPGFGFADYLRLYESHERALLEQRAPGSTEYPDALFLTWTATIGKLSAGARAVLRLCSFLAPGADPGGSAGERRGTDRCRGWPDRNGASWSGDGVGGPRMEERIGALFDDSIHGR